MMMLIPKEVRREVNAAAHRMGLKYEADLRDSLLARFMDDQNNGATSSDMIRSLQEIEAGRKKG